MTTRYFAETPITGGRATLAGPEAHHLIHVMRLRAGDRVALFDGSGAEFTAAVERVGRSEVELAVLERHAIDRELPREVTLGVALPKGDRQKWLVEKAVELGIGRIVPLVTARGVAQPVDQALARLRRTVVEASKQCGRNRLMAIADPQDWSDFVASGGADCCRWMAQPGGARPVLTPTSAAQVLLAVGPEGGWAADEVALASSAAWQAVDLGPRVLRVETAAILLSALLSLG